MKIFYVTLSKTDEARDISRALLQRRLAVCCNWFPITCAYRREGKLVEEAQTILLIKTQPGYREHIESVVGQLVSYAQCTLEIAPESVNARFRAWLDAEVPAVAGNSPSAAQGFDAGDWYRD